MKSFVRVDNISLLFLSMGHNQISKKKKKPLNNQKTEEEK
jgi:hypothetical protein